MGFPEGLALGHAEGKSWILLALTLLTLPGSILSCKSAFLPLQEAEHELSNSSYSRASRTKPFSSNSKCKDVQGGL